jgi:Zn-dependent protease
MQPILKSGVELGTFTEDDSDELHYYAEDEEGNAYEIGVTVFEELLRADGINVLDLPDDVISKLEKLDLIQTRRFVKSGHLLNRFILFPVGHRIDKYRELCAKLNKWLIPVSSVVYISGFIASICDSSYYSVSVLSPGPLILLLISVLLHETGHLIAGAAYGYRIYDIGLLLIGRIPYGAYVSIGQRKGSTRTEKTRFSLAGIRMNLLFAGIFNLVSAAGFFLPGIMAKAAELNIILATVNLFPAFGLDGASALSASTGINNLSRLAHRCLFKKRNRKRLLRSGTKGYAYMGLFIITVLFEILFVLLIIFDLISIPIILFS